MAKVILKKANVTYLITNRPMAGHCRKVVVLCVLPNKGGTHNEKETQAIIRRSKGG